MKVLLIGISLFLMMSANANTLYVHSSEDVSLETMVCGNGGLNESSEAWLVGCHLGLTTTSFPTVVVHDEVVEINTPESMAALMNGNEEVATVVGLHFDVSGDKILETVAEMDAAGVEITLEDIGNNL